MVAKIKSSFLKTGFQFFCHKNIFHPKNELSEQQLRVNKANAQFSSSPNLSFNPLVVNNGKVEHKPDENSPKPVRSLSASGRVVENENELNSPPTKAHQSHVSKKDETKPKKNIPKYLAKSKQQHHQNSKNSFNNSLMNNPGDQVSESASSTDEKLLAESLKPRSKSSTATSRTSATMNRHSFTEPLVVSQPLNSDSQINNSDAQLLEQIHNVNNSVNNNTILSANQSNQVEQSLNSINSSLVYNNTSMYRQCRPVSRNAANDDSSVIESAIISHRIAPSNRLSKQEPPNSILIKTQNNKIARLFNNNNSNESHENSRFSNNNINAKKVVRFADSLGLELESIITLHQMDTNINRRRVKLNANSQPNMFQYKNYAYSTTRANTDKFNFAKPNVTTSGVYYADMLRHNAENETRKYFNANQFEAGNNGPCLYDEIINKLAYENASKYRYSSSFENNSKKFHAYENNEQADTIGNKVLMPGSSSSTNLTYYQQPNYRFNSDNNNEYNASMKPTLFVRGNNNINASSPLSTQNITITTRINNGKLESEV